MLKELPLLLHLKVIGLTLLGTLCPVLHRSEMFFNWMDNAAAANYFLIKISADNDDEQMLQGQAIIFFSQSTYVYFPQKWINIQSIRKITLCLIRCLQPNQISPWDQRMLISSHLVVTTVKHRNIRYSLLSLLKQSNDLDNSLSNLINNNIYVILIS